jgi:AraC-like DNA-binding protein
LIRCKSPTKRRLAFRRAIEYAESLKQPITVPEFAAAAGVSRRVLEMAFQETLSNTPLQYLHRRRLNFVHRELLNAEPGSSSVTEVAIRWGYSELGRFAVEYKRLFGESPSTTLKASRRPVSMILMDSLLQ